MGGDLKKGEQLLTALEQGNFSLALTLIKEGADVNVGEEGLTALFYATELGEQYVATALIEAGADLAIKDPWGYHPFARACSCSMFLIAKLILTKGGDVNAHIRDEGETILHMTVRLGKFKIVEFLIEQKANLNAQDAEGNTPLHCAAEQPYWYEKSSLQISNMLLESGADSNVKNKQGMTPLHLAAKAGNAAMVKVLLKYSEREPKNLRLETPMHLAAKHKKTDVLLLLIEAGCNVNVQTDDLNTPLHYAVKKNRFCSVIALLEVSKSVNIKNFNGETALYIAARERYDDVVECFLERRLSLGLEVNNIGEKSLLSFYESNKKIKDFLSWCGCVNKDPQVFAKPETSVVFSEGAKKSVSFASDTNFNTRGRAVKHSVKTKEDEFAQGFWTYEPF